MKSALLLLAASPALVSSSPASVTCNSAIKVTHTESSYHVCSGEINWGSGSGQQSITASPMNGENACIWVVKGAHGDGANCELGKPVKCDGIVRLTHLDTGKNLHSHGFRSPLSGQQEVSGFGNQGVGDVSDNWKVECDPKTSSGTWDKDTPVRLKHVETGRYLGASSNTKFTQQNCPNCPIVGQLEVAAFAKSNDGTKFVAQRGMFIKMD